MLNKESRASTIICILCLLIGTALLAFSTKELYEYSNKSNNYTNINAKVIKHHYEDGKPISVILEYKIEETSYTTTSTSYDDCIKSYGSLIPIKYNPNNPEEIIFVNQSINIVAPIVALVLLSIGLSIIIVQISDTLKGFKKKLHRNNSVQNKPVNNEKEVIDISDVFKKPAPIKVEEKIEPKKEEKKQEIVTIPTPPKEEITTKTNYNDINYKDFITEVNEKEEDIPSFIPNADEINKKR